MDEPRIVTARARFDAAQVRVLLHRAEQAGQGVELVKDECAYLMTWNVDGTQAEDVIVYADGHRPPPRPDTSTFAVDDPGEPRYSPSP